MDLFIHRKKTFCQQRADAHKLTMKVIECEHLFGGERIIFYFMSEGRIDFRALVKELVKIGEEAKKESR